MITQEQINRGGSKLEITRALFEAGLDRDLPIPRSTLKYYGYGLDPVLPAFLRMKTPVIVRGSHPNDYHGFIDVVPTIKNVNTVSQLEEAVKIIEESMLRPEVKAHCEDWNQPYTPEVHLLIQEQGSPIVGSMLRNPHDRNKLMIQYVNSDHRDPNDWARDIVSVALSLRSGEIFHSSDLDIPDSEIKKLIEMYEKLEASGVLDNEWSQQVEFGLCPLGFYQARPFKKFQKPADFSVWDIMQEIEKNKEVSYINSYESFGITPKEGIDMEFVGVNSINLYGPYGNVDLPNDKPYGLIVQDKLKRGVRVEQPFFDLRVYATPVNETGYLFHNDYRLIKRAQISLIEQVLRDSEGKKIHTFSGADYRNFKESRVFADGKKAIIVPRKFLE